MRPDINDYRRAVRESYAVSDELKWEIGRKYTEGVDFIIQSQYLSYDEKTWMNNYNRSELELQYIKRPFRHACIPLSKQPVEDKLIVETRECQHCKNHRRDMNGSFCVKLLMAVTRSMKVTYKASKGTCFEPVEDKPDCSNHPREVLGCSDMKELARRTANMHYEKLSEYLFELQTALHNDSINDMKIKRRKLSHHLRRASSFMYEASNEIESAWQISKPFMKS